MLEHKISNLKKQISNKFQNTNHHLLIKNKKAHLITRQAPLIFYKLNYRISNSKVAVSVGLGFNTITYLSLKSPISAALIRLFVPGSDR